MTTIQEEVPCEKREKGCIDGNDAAGTKPNRYNYEQLDYTDYKENFRLMPENHPAPDERLVHPDRGE